MKHCKYCSGKELLEKPKVGSLTLTNGVLEFIVDGFTTTLEMNFCPACGRQFGGDHICYAENEGVYYRTIKGEDVRTFEITEDSYFFRIDYRGGGTICYKIPRNFTADSGLFRSEGKLLKVDRTYVLFTNGKGCCDHVNHNRHNVDCRTSIYDGYILSQSCTWCGKNITHDITGDELDGDLAGEGKVLLYCEGSIYEGFAGGRKLKIFTS